MIIEDAIRSMVSEEVSREYREIEGKIWGFMKRTGLPNTEIVLVHFRGKCFPQWRGAVKP